MEAWSYLKFPFYRGLGYPNGSYRVGPLGRVNACDDISTPEASAELAAFRKLTEDGVVHYTMYYHYARLIETLYGLERIEELLDDEDIMGSDLRVHSRNSIPRNRCHRGAPGTLIHHYEVDDRGAITRVNLIVATGHNNFAMNKGVELVPGLYQGWQGHGRDHEPYGARDPLLTIRVFPAPPMRWGKCPCASRCSTPGRSALDQERS